MFLKKENRSVFLQDQEEGEAEGQEVLPTKRGGMLACVFAGGDQGPQGILPPAGHRVLVGMTSQDAAGEADAWVDAGRMCEGTRGCQGCAEEGSEGLGAAPGFRERRRHLGKRCVVGWRS